ncbi:MAG: hypothetical protein IPM63_11190 [Acidobacteriota bacterium]|nr:MAG: hypothetical protein IPM63_11190 [Acidobacteriota bacterium]
MRNKSFAFLAAAFVIGASLVFTGGSEARSNELAALLPQSDGVLVLDVRKLFDESLPQILSANEPLLAKINGEANKIKTRTGLDLRQFDVLALGVRTKQVDEKTLNVEPVILARGPYNGNSLAEAAKMASEGKSRTEEFAGRTVYIFSAKEIVDRNRPLGAGSQSVFEKMFDKVLNGLSDEVALAAYDSNTVALGSLGRVKELLGNSPRIENRLLEMLGRKQNAVASFGMVVPDGLSRYFELEEDELGESLNSVREVNGTLDTLPGRTMLSIAARTVDAKQAENLEIMLSGFRGLFAGILKQQKGEDKKVYGRMLENLSVDRNETELTVSLEIPQGDLDIIVGKK